jgi:glyoxylase-like metal-dependent hydrolase (beta-lactamase superfamily II)
MGNKIDVYTIVVNPLATNCHILYDLKTKDAVVFDPGGDADEIYLEIGRLNLIARLILLTHAHVDHVAGARELKELIKCPIGMHPAEKFLLKTAPIQAPLFGMPIFRTPEIDFYIEDGQEIEAGSIRLKALHIPGHSPGSLCFYCPPVLISGDVLFQGSIGRTDLPGGDYESLINGVKEKIFTLPDDTIVYPGHGPSTTVRDEKLYNPFFGE